MRPAESMTWGAAFSAAPVPLLTQHCLPDHNSSEPSHRLRRQSALPQGAVCLCWLEGLCWAGECFHPPLSLLSGSVARDGRPSSVEEAYQRSGGRGVM